MHLREIALNSFVLVQAEWLAVKARQLIESLTATHVVVRRTQPADYYYLYTRADALNYLLAAGQGSVHDAFGLHEYTASPALDAYTDADTAPDFCVVVEDGQAVGFYDANVPPSEVMRSVSDKREHAQGEPVTRALVADFPEQVKLETTTSLLVSLSTQLGQAAALQFTAAGTSVDVVIQPKRGFELMGLGEGQLSIAGEEETLPLQFQLKATAVGPGLIRVFAFQQGQALGVITLAPTVVPAAEEVGGARHSQEQPIGAASVNPPDLSLLIEERTQDGNPAVIFRLTASDPRLNLNLKRFGPVPLRMNPLHYFLNFFKDIENLPLETAQDKAAVEHRLAAKGGTLFNLLPDELQRLLWSLKDNIKSIQIQSEEPWIPWELCKLQGEENGRIVEGQFLCEAYDVTRWLPEIGFKPSLTLNKIALVVPADSGLPLAASERDYILALAGNGRRVESIPAKFLDLRRALASGEYDGWHFTGHGGFRAPDPNRSAMLLENGEEFTPEDLSGVVSNVGLARPLVFLNACQIGRSAMSLTDIGGWAARFLHAGAGAFIGAYWSVYDRPAHDFATAFYNHLLAGLTVGRAVREARASIKSLGDPTWLAYTVFADPSAKVR
jgi:hypothetical protein